AYTALHPLTGRHVRARVEAENREAAVALLRAQRLRLLALDEAPPLTGWRARFASARKASRHRMSAAQRAWFTRQLAALVGAG
ncbi:MAG TPA: hypothetical protein PKX00_25870, partial [Opitutaceae bacterium]|nr:hypothetical protein [Opitutaceae bacterium]